MIAGVRRILTIFLVGMVALSCSSSSSVQSEVCEQAAIAQAAAEERWGQIIEEHLQADEAVADDPSSQAARSAHDHSAAELVGARVDVILAEAETRQRCG